MPVGSKQAAAQGTLAGVVLECAPLGIATSIIADDSALLDAATANVAAACRELPDGDPRITLRLRWNALATAKVGFEVAVKGSCLTLEGEGVLARADAAAGTAECSLSRAYGGHPRMLAEIGETLLLFLLARSDRTPVHAASVMIGGTAILLAGPSGAGKSSLAHAAQRQGLAVLSEDTTYVQLEPRLRIWGWPGPIHLLPDDAPQGAFTQRWRGGRRKAAIPRTVSAAFADRAILIRIVGRGRLALRHSAAEQLVRRLSPNEPGFALLRPQIERAIARLAIDGGWRLTLGDRPEAAIALLRERFADLAR